VYHGETAPTKPVCQTGNNDINVNAYKPKHLRIFQCLFSYTKCHKAPNNNLCTRMES